MTADHARLAPSAAPQWVPCPASVQMSEAYPAGHVDTDSAREGTAAHWVVSEALLGRAPRVGDRAPNGYVITQEMVDGVAAIAAAAPWLWVNGPLVDLRVYMPEVHPTDCWGTLDLGAVDTVAKVVDVLDYKFGFSYVPAFENWQGVLYLSGLREAIGADLTWSYRVTVVQPRWYGAGEQHRTWTMSGTELAHYESVAARSAAQSELKAPPANTGPHCRHCAGRYGCAALQASAAAAVDVARDGDTAPTDSAAIGLELALLTAAADRIKARSGALEQLAIRQLLDGKAVPGWSLDRTKPREKWTVPDDDVLALGAALGVDVSKPGVVTPAQARKAGLSAELVNQYCAAPSGELKLVPMAGAAIRAFVR